MANNEGEERQHPEAVESEGSAPLDESRSYFLLFQTGYGNLNYPLARQVETWLLGADKRERVDIWVDSLGGDADATYKILLALRQHFKQVNAVIPSVAKSAATLLALGCDDLYMEASAELGPLDVQIPHTGDKLVSALDATRCVEYMAQLAVGIVLTGGADILQITGLTRQDTLDAMLAFAADFMAPIMAKLDPTLIHEASRHLCIAEEYAKRLLPRHLYGKSSFDQLRKDQRLRIDGMIRKLVHGYTSHSFVISSEEARRRIGLKVKDIEEYDRCDAVRQAYRMFLSGEQDLVMLVSDGDLGQVLAPIMPPGEEGSEHESSH